MIYFRGLGWEICHSPTKSDMQISRLVPKTSGDTSPFADIDLQEMGAKEWLNPSFADWDGEGRLLAGFVVGWVGGTLLHWAFRPWGRQKCLRALTQCILQHPQVRVSAVTFFERSQILFCFRGLLFCGSCCLCSFCTTCTRRYGCCFFRAVLALTLRAIQAWKCPDVSSILEQSWVLWSFAACVVQVMAIWTS